MGETRALAEALIDPHGRVPVHTIAETLERFGSGALRLAHGVGTRIYPMQRETRYTAVSPALRRLGINVDDWPAPPAGLFVVEERTVYLRSRSAMTVAHEFGHALDCALGGGVYRSGIDPALRILFNAAKQFVTPYSASGIDEYFAEALRSWIEVNDRTSHWPRATKARLRRIDPGLYDYVERLFHVDFQAAA